MTTLLERAYALFDAHNQQDPTVFTWGNRTYPKEFFLSQCLHQWVQQLDPNASEALLLASRCQHIGRWEIPRKSFPEGRIGYLSWRKALMRHHAQLAATYLTNLGYASPVIAAVEAIVMKRNLKQDADVQTMENALCLVFLQYQYADFYPGNADKIVDVLHKSLLKMDALGHRFALTLPYDAQGYAYIEQALSRM
jgi:hypothetical protein